MSFEPRELVREFDDGSQKGYAEQDGYLTRSQAWSLYLLHFLFAWNARTYEFAAVGY